MTGGTISVSALLCEMGQFMSILTKTIVHGEPSPDRETYAKDVADWILARSGDSTVRSKL